MENLFLLNTVLVIIICGLILKLIGNFILASYTKTKNTNINSCSQNNNEEKNNNGYNGYTLSFTGITIIGMSLLFIMILIIYISVYSNRNVKDLIKLLIPIFITLLVVSYNYLINIKFQDRLIKGDIAEEYFGYLMFYSLLLFCQIICISKYIKDLYDIKNESKVGPVIYLLSLINMIILGIMNIIIAYFSTDG